MVTALKPLPPAGIIDWDETDLYRFFAFAFGTPDPDRHHWLSAPGVQKSLAILWHRLECEGEFPGFEWFPNYPAYEAAYIALFDVGVPEPPVPLFESAHDKSRPAQELVLEATYFYDVIELRVNPAVSTPDHLLTQLEFLSAVTYAREHAATETKVLDLNRLEREFLERHMLNWTDLAYKKLRECPMPAFPVLFCLLIRLLRWRQELLASERP
jgi:DMSO reductase family type II enzyme chaperone